MLLPLKHQLSQTNTSAILFMIGQQHTEGEEGLVLSILYGRRRLAQCKGRRVLHALSSGVFFDDFYIMPPCLSSGYSSHPWVTSPDVEKQVSFLLYFFCFFFRCGMALILCQSVRFQKKSRGNGCSRIRISRSPDKG